MSRSFRKAVIKEKGKFNSSYNKTVRRVNKSIVKQFKTNYQEIEPLEYNEEKEEYFKPEFFDGYTGFSLIGPEDKIKHPKEIINDYDISDHKTNFEAFTSKELEKYNLVQDKIKLRRK